MSTPRFDVLGIGENATDTVLQLPQFPALGSKVEMLGAQILPGGQVATALIACQRWGLRTHYVGVVGDDSAAEIHRRELRRGRATPGAFCAAGSGAPRVCRRLPLLFEPCLELREYAGAG